MTTINQKKVLRMYEKTDIGSLELFGGGFINFGYWGKLPHASITDEERVESQKEMYRFVSKKLDISSSDDVLEIGCGKGVGAALVASEFNPHKIFGLDFSALQIERAKKTQKQTSFSLKKLSFKQGAAEKISFPDSSFHKLFSIEALQHFSDIEQFVAEAFRVLKTSGKLAIATFFQTGSGALPKLKELIPTFSDKIDYAIPIQEFKEILKRESFTNVKIQKFGKHVWHGWDKWVGQTKYNDHWDRNWLKAYQDGLVDYYLVTAEKC